MAFLPIPLVPFALVPIEIDNDLSIRPFIRRPNRQRKSDIAHGDAAGRGHFLSAHCQSKLVACTEYEQVGRKAGVRGCGYAPRMRLAILPALAPWPFHLSVSHSIPHLVADERCHARMPRRSADDSAPLQSFKQQIWL